MSSISKSFSLLLILILALSIMMAKPAFAQSPTPSPVPFPTPSVPQFTVQLVGPPTVVNTTYSLDPNTGKIVARIGYINEYSYVELIIKNQPFNPSYGSMYFNVQVKNQNTNNVWTDIYSVQSDNQNYPEQTANSDYTNVLIGIEGQFTLTPTLVGTQTDIQVQALIGNIYVTAVGFTGELYAFNGTESDWSTTQTVSIPANIPLSPTPAPSSSSSTPTPTLTPVSSASSSLLLLTTTIALVVIAFLLAVIIALLLYMRKRNRLLESSLKGLTKADTSSM
jgi:hypothetical protein